MTPVKVKKIYKIRAKESTNGAPEVLFYLVDENDNVVSPATGTQSRHKLFELAIERGADEVKHDYDCIKHP
jgi:hypothetical protein